MTAFKRTAGVVVAALVLLAATPAAHAQLPGPLTASIGFEVREVDGATRTVTGIIHCVAPALAGQTRQFRVADGVDLGALAPNTVVSVSIAEGPSGPVITGLAPKMCDVRPGATSPPPGQNPQIGAILGDGGPQPPQPGAGQPPMPGGGPMGGPQGGVTPQLSRGFLGRVWRFVGEADSFSDGKLAMTVTKLLNVPRRFAAEDDDLVDQDAIVLVSQNVRVYDGKKLVKERKEASALSDAEDVRVQGKLLPPAKWQKDEDGEPVQTIRAKKIYILD